MTLNEIIFNVNELSDDSVIYAKRIEGHFTCNSEAVILQLTEEESNWYITDIAQKYCPGFDYFLESDIIKDFVKQLKGIEEYSSPEKLVSRVIYYAEFDA